LPAVPICALKIHAPTRTIVAGTYGLSCYKASLDDILTGIPTRETIEKIALSASPNPVQNQARLNFFLPSDDHITVSIFSLNGRMVKLVYEGDLRQGRQNIPCDLGNEGKNIPSGLYIMEVKGKHSSGSLKMLKL